MRQQGWEHYVLWPQNAGVVAVSLDVLQNAMYALGIDTLAITSSQRTAAGQARAMLNNQVNPRRERGLYQRMPTALAANSIPEQINALGWDKDVTRRVTLMIMATIISGNPNEFPHVRDMTDRVTIDIGPNSIRSSYLTNQLYEECQCTLTAGSLQQRMAQRLAMELAKDPRVVGAVLSPPADAAVHVTIRNE